MTSASRNTGPAVVCMGRMGDVTAAVPIAHHLAYQTGQVTPFITAPEYAPFLEAFSYIAPVPFDVPFHKVNRSIKHHQNRYSELHVAQVYSTDEGHHAPITESFVTDSWQRAGFSDHFGLPLVVDRRDAQREAQLLSSIGLDHSTGYIVVHAAGISSPYPYRFDLLKALRTGQRVIDISALMASKPQDLLAVLERASCAILADSFPLHLSFALRDLPVIALQTDRPNNWFGAPPRPNWIANYRYEESKAKLGEIVALAAAQTMPKATYSFPAGAYNASIAPGLLTWRYHPNGTWQTRLRGVQPGKPPCEIKIPTEASQEDARLFTHKGKQFISYTLATYNNRQPRCLVEYGELTLGREWQVKNPQRVKYGANDFTGMEKNHVFFSVGGKLYCLYGSHPEQVILEVEGSKVVKVHRAPGASWAFGDIRGDVMIPHDGKLLRVFHSCERFPSGKFRYHLGVALHESAPPFRVLKVNPVPLFSGDESRPKTVFHSKHSVVFSCGAIIEGDELLLCLSRNDDSTTIQRIKLNRLGL